MNNNRENLDCLSPLVRIAINGSNTILSNLLNGKWIKIEKENLSLFNASDTEGVMKNCLLRGFNHEEAKKFVETLISNKFFFTEDLSNSNKGRLAFSLHTAYLHITNFCNLSCKHCYRDSHSQLKHGVDIDSMFVVVDRLRNAGIKFLVIAGGEPLARPGVEDLLKHIRHSQFDSVTLLTNGTIMTEQLAKLIANCVDSTHVSLDGPNEEINAQIRGSGNFEKTISGIKKLKSAGVNKIKIITTITSGNISHLHEMSCIQKELGVDFGTSIFAEVGRGSEYSFLKPNISDIVKYFRDKIVSLDCSPVTTDSNLLDINTGVTCGSGTYMVSVDCFGNVFPCHLLHEQELKIGNIVEQENLLEMIQESPIIKQMQERIVESRKCHGCSVEYFCKGGCFAHTISANRQSENPWLEKDPLCNVHKEILSIQLWES